MNAKDYMDREARYGEAMPSTTTAVPSLTVLLITIVPIALLL